MGVLLGKGRTVINASQVDYRSGFTNCETTYSHQETTRGYCFCVYACICMFVCCASPLGVESLSYCQTIAECGVIQPTKQKRMNVAVIQQEYSSGCR